MKAGDRAGDEMANEPDPPTGTVIARLPFKSDGNGRPVVPRQTGPEPGLVGRYVTGWSLS